jgi:tetratricopeptide (TPR) repeat protein
MGTVSIAESLSVAYRHFQAGGLGEAERVCREILAAYPQQDAAMHLLGLIALRCGHSAMAVEWIAKACARNPQNAEAFGNLGIALEAACEVVQAAASFERAVELNPAYAEAWTNLGNLRMAQGRLDEAIGCHRRATAGRPNYPEAWCNLGIALAARKLLDDTAEALKSIEQALELNPGFAEAHNNLGLLLQDRGETQRALDEFDRALSLRPNYAEAHNSRGFALESQRRLDAAADEYVHALKLKPDYAEAHNNRGGLLQSQGRLAEAAECFDCAVALKPDFAIAHYNRALLSLLLGDFEAGFREYEWRWRFLPGREFSFPLWRGQPLLRKRILLHAEQGLGDAIQFLRYVPLVIAAGGVVVLEVGEPLLRLAQAIPEVSRVLSFSEPPPECDWHCPLMSLPLAFETRLDSIPAQVPYLAVPEAARRKADSLQMAGSGLRVGLVWAGNPKHKKDRDRSIAFRMLERLFSANGVSFFSLQMDAVTEDLARANVLGITDLAPEIEDLADTAALLQRLDLLISVDTAVAHLAGALGVPAWVLLPFAPDWRWLLERADSPWYPSLRLFRQPRPGDWASVMEAVHAALADEQAKSEHSAHLPPDGDSA